MYHIDFNKPQHIHFIGIGGISMSGLAEILLERGFRISGSDARESDLTERLIENGAEVFYGQRAENVMEGIDAVVHTAAVHADNPEYMEAVRQGLPVLTRAELLGQIMKNYAKAVAVAGTHGKTTTTSMLTEILVDAGQNPTISVGGMLDSIGGNIRVGGQELFVTEACEYTNSFLSFFPTMAVILNVEADHLDFFKDIDEIRRSFRRFAGLLPEDGILIINSDIREFEALCEGLTCRVVTVGSRPEMSRYSAQNIVFGQIKNGLLRYTGTHRRFEKKGEVGGVTVIDDYAHHPQEIAATLSTAQNYSHREIWCVFQPHTYTRTKQLLEDFVKALSAADHVVLADIYAARETDTLGVSSKLLAEKIAACGTDVHYFPTFDEIETFILEKCVKGDLLITMGAGDVVKIGEKLLGQ